MTDVSFLDIVKLCEFYVQKNDKQNYN
jgi:hypothetical protein